MQVVSICPLQVASVGWQPRAGSHAITVVCKATFVLRAGQSELADVQDYPNDEDNHWNDDPNRSLYSASDLAPFKPQADVTLVGEAYAPEGRPVRSVLTRLRMGAIDKSIEVVLDRHRGSDGELIEGKRFARMSLRYERAATGPRGNNPVGVNPKAKPDELGRRPLANLLPLGTGARDDVVPTVGYGPIAPSWPSRQGLLGRHAAGWSSTRWHEQPLPDDIDAGFFNVAPSDQRIDEIHCSERIVLDNLHPEEPRLVCHLPGIRPRVFVERQNAIRELAMHGDTLWIDTTRCVCTVTWRGRVDLDRAAEQGRVLIAMERPGQQLSWNDVRQLTASTAHELEPLEEPTDDLPQPATENAPIISSIREERTAVAEEFTAIGIPAPKAAPLPFVHDDQGEPAADRDAPLTQQHLATAALPILNVSPEDRSPAWLNQSAIYQPPQPHELVAPAAPQPTGRSESYAAPADAAASAPPPQPTEEHDGATAGSVSPWAKKTKTSPPPAGATSDALASASGASSIPLPPIAVRPPDPVADLHREGSKQAVDRRADESRPLARPDSGEIVELIWFAQESLDKLRVQPSWSALLASLQQSRQAETDDFGFDEEPPPPEPDELADRRDVVSVMTQAPRLSGAALKSAMLDAVDPSGSFEAPLVLLSGQLSFPFDPLEILKATVTAVSPLIAGNKQLKETVDTVNELLQTPWLESSSEVVNGLTDKVRAAFKKGDRVLDPSSLDDHTKRILLEQRCYQKRVVFGDTWIRALFTPTNSKQQIPTYLPDSLCKELPMFTSFAARVVGEAHVQQDQYESHDIALKLVALGRSIRLSARS